jgi:hypothetical protein
MRNQYTPNEITVEGDIAYIELYNKKNEPIAKAIIDREDVVKVKERKWCINDQGYVLSGAGKKRIKLHHLVYCKVPGIDIDHKNGNTLDNRKVNLRKSTHSQNLANRGLQRNNSSGFKGVTYDKSTFGWKARIQVNGKYVYLGQFKEKIKAAIAYNNAALKYFGEFAVFNEV